MRIASDSRSVTSNASNCLEQVWNLDLPTIKVTTLTKWEQLSCLPKSEISSVCMCYELGRLGVPLKLEGARKERNVVVLLGPTWTPNSKVFS